MICIGISKYDDGIPDVPEVKNDIEQYIKIFKDDFNYQVIVNNYDELCSAEFLLNCLTETYSPYLYDDDGNALFNGLIVTISGHCTDHSIICSDGKPLPFTEILSIFTDQWCNKSLSLNLPKFLWIDGKRGFDVKTLKIKDEPESKANNDNKMTYSSILRSISTTNSSVYSGQMAWNLCQLFGKNKDHKQLIFYDIIINLRQRLHQSIYQQFSFKFTVHDDEIDDIQFKPNKTKKAVTRIRRTQSLAPMKKAPIPPKKAKKLRKLKASKDDNDIKEEEEPDSPPSFRRAQSAGAPLKSAPNVPFSDTNVWGKTMKIITEDNNKTRVKIEWVFVDKKGATHNAVITHSQKTDTTLKASRGIYIDGNKMYSKKSTQSKFIHKYKKMTLEFRIEVIDNQWKYSLFLNNISFERAYENWKLRQYAE